MRGEEEMEIMGMMSGIGIGVEILTISAQGTWQ